MVFISDFKGIIMVYSGGVNRMDFKYNGLMTAKNISMKSIKKVNPTIFSNVRIKQVIFRGGLQVRVQERILPFLLQIEGLSQERGCIQEFNERVETQQSKITKKGVQRVQF